MSTFVSKDLQNGLDAARMARQKRDSRLRVSIGETLLPVLRLWDTGFAVDLQDAPRLRGFVDLYDGASHLYQCLIVASEDVDGERRYEFKRSTAIAEGPALDFERAPDAPVALIGTARV